MPRLTIHLQTGFADDTVVVRVNGAEVYRKEGVKTSLLLGYADVFDCPVPEGTAHVDIEVPSRGVRASFDVPVSARTHLGVSLRGGTVEHFVSTKAFAYM
jgi:hypothetical protein